MSSDPNNNNNPRKRTADDSLSSNKPGRYDTRSADSDKRQKAVEDEKALAARKAAELEELRRTVLANQPQAPPGNRGDGKLHMAFIRMGQGDCTVVSTPAGRTLIIDCGSDATEFPDKQAYYREIQDTLYGPKFLKPRVLQDGQLEPETLDFLILTHADTDHYNRLKQVLKDTLQIQNIYHSAKLDHYSVGQQSTWLRAHLVSELKAKGVTINENGEKKLNGVVVAPPDDNNKVDRLDSTGLGIQIHVEDNCKISLLAGNVATDSVGDNSNVKNRGSLVTLIEAFGKKIMICGDATRSTEKFLVDTHKERIASLDLLHVPHHGSAVTSSSDLFVDKVKPKKIVVSAAKQAVCDHLPGAVTIAKYKQQLQDNAVPSHEIFYWEGEPGNFTSKSEFITKNLYITGSNLTQYVSFPEAQQNQNENQNQ